MLAIGAAALAVLACETPVNDTDLPPQPVSDASSSSSSSRTSTPSTDTTAARPPDSGGQGETADLDTTSSRTADSGPEPVVQDAAVQAPEDAATDPLLCESEEACLAYWEAYSTCLVQRGGPTAEVNPELYIGDSRATCDLASLVDLVTYYECEIAGIPNDCAIQPPDPSNCST